jgi:hypothetical protein
MTVKKVIAPERIAEARRMYEESDAPTREIAAFLDMSRGTLDNRITEWGWTRRRYSAAKPPAADAAAAVQTDVPPDSKQADAPETPAPAPAADAGNSVAAAPAFAEAGEPPPAEVPLPFAQRMQRVLEGELAVIERTLKVLGPASNAEAERTTRILAAISRTIQEIQATAAGQTSSHETNDDPVPGDIDEFRETLARRLQGFIEAQREEASGGGC